MSSIPSIRVWPFWINSGSKLPSLSRGMSIGTAPSLPFSTLRAAPLRRLDCWCHSSVNNEIPQTGVFSGRF